MSPYAIPFGKHKGKLAVKLSDNTLAGLAWAYRPEGFNDEDLHGECFAILYERYGSAEAVMAVVNNFEAWVSGKKEVVVGRKKAKPKKAKSIKKEDTSNRVLYRMGNKDIYIPSDVTVGPSNELCPF